MTPAEINEYLRDAFPGVSAECTEVGHNFAVGRRPVSADMIRPGGFVSGPTQFAIADAVLWFALFGAVGIEPMAMTSELSIRYLRPAAGITVFARAELAAAGRRNVVGTVKVWMDDRADRPTSVAQGTYVRPATAAGYTTAAVSAAVSEV